MWKITLADGTILDNLALNGNNFISSTEVTPDTFAGKLSRVTITPPADYNDVNGMTGTFEHMRLDALNHYPDGWYFVLNPIPDDEIQAMRDRADLEYIAMMAGVEL